MPAQQTPGPWGVSFNERNKRTGAGDWYFFSPRGPLLKNGLASARDAHVMAAAPELYEIVKCYWRTRSEEKWKAEEPEIHAAILAVIDKIEGRAFRANPGHDADGVPIIASVHECKGPGCECHDKVGA